MTGVTDCLSSEGVLIGTFVCYRMCSLPIECVLFLQNVFSFYRMTGVTDCLSSEGVLIGTFVCYRMCSLPTECVLFL